MQFVLTMSGSLADSRGMTTSRMTDQTTQDLKALEDLLAQIAELTERADALKWRIVDRREIGAQTAVARVYGIKRQSLAQQISARAAKQAAREYTPADEIRVGDVVHAEDGRDIEVREIVRGKRGELTVNPGADDELSGRIWHTARVTRHTDRRSA